MPMTDSSNMGLGARSDFRGEDIVLYTAPDGTVKLDVRLDKETVWLTQSHPSRNCSRPWCPTSACTCATPTKKAS
jgi:hypothetical protein